MKENLEFRRLLSNELDTGYAVHLEAYEWLKSKGSKQWPKPFPYEKYRLWHERRLNYGFFSNDTLATVFSIVEETDDRWADYLQGRCVVWVRAVAGSGRFRNKGFGRLAIRAAIRQFVHEKSIPLYLHCYKGSGFLPEYYSRLGFNILSETELDNGLWVLLKYPGED
jgi:GNAT superfamily N-acetyltransferase